MTLTTTQTTTKNNNPWSFLGLSDAMNAVSSSGLSVVGIPNPIDLSKLAKDLEDGFNNLTNPNNNALVVKNDTENDSSKILATLISGAQKIIPSTESLDPLLEKATEMTKSASAGIGKMTTEASVGIGQMTTEASARVAPIIAYFEKLSEKPEEPKKTEPAPSTIKKTNIRPLAKTVSSKSEKSDPTPEKEIDVETSTTKISYFARARSLFSSKRESNTESVDDKSSQTSTSRVSSLRRMFSSKSDESNKSSEKSDSGFLKRAFSFASSNSNSTSAPTRDAPSVASSSDKKNLARASSVTSETSTVLSRSRSWGSYFSSKGPLADAPKASDSPPRASYLQRTRTFISETKKSTSNFIKEKKGSFREWKDDRDARLRKERAERKAKKAAELKEWRYERRKKREKEERDREEKEEERKKNDPEYQRQQTIKHLLNFEDPIIMEEFRRKAFPHIHPTELMSNRELFQHGLTRVVRTVTPTSPIVNYQYKKNGHVELEGTITGSSVTSALTTIGSGLARGAKKFGSGVSKIGSGIASVASEAGKGRSGSASWEDAKRTFGSGTGVTPLTAQELAGGAVNFLSDKSSTVGIGTVIAGAGRELGAGLKQMTPSTSPKFPTFGRLTVWTSRS